MNKQDTNERLKQAFRTRHQGTPGLLQTLAGIVAEKTEYDTLNFEGSRALTRAINFQCFYTVVFYISKPFGRYIVIHGSTGNDARTKHFARQPKRLSVTLSLSSVIGRFRSVNCSRLEVRVLLLKLSRSVHGSAFVGFVYVVYPGWWISRL